MIEPRRTGDPTKTLIALAAALALTTSACSRPATRADDVAAAPEPVASAEVPAPSEVSSSAVAPPPSASAAAAAPPCAGVPARPGVEAHEGNIYFCAQDGAARKLTASGKDDSPALSPDGKRVVFVRAEGIASVEADEARVTDNRILLFDLASGQTREIAKNGTCLSLWSPVFAFDDFVLLDARGYEIPRYTYTSVCGVDLRKKTPEVKTVASGTDCVTAIRSGPHRGHLYAEGYRSPGPTEYFAIVDRSGHIVRELEASAMTEDPPEGPVAQTGAFCRPSRRLDFRKK
ncbi:hypothetical protein [Polyangium jinanense]|uniref:PD40 domain-containing protein n=1 Tax=Polyangium jinanense TaxID=2829994 RepID=A0A9X3XCJ1_9BACT|nr:hypothetical protein [Polyangium jinanense]MDC3961453.1 PD40 domain-containing protein [Polyangium jinanense]MDC3987884.1 PD40 domain-containing protein [Polyangium jinanense]